MKVRVKIKRDGRALLMDALERAVERGMNRCDKYSDVSLTDQQRRLLVKEIDDSFWLSLDEDGVVIE